MNPPAHESRAPAVEVRQVTKHFGEIVAVDNVSLSVSAGEFLTLLGPSGCGKTTLLRLIAGFEMPDRGAVLFEGVDHTAVPAHRRNVNQVFQSYALFPHLSARDNIAFGLKMQRLPTREIAQRVEETLALVSLAGCEDRKPHQLSGGQRQRVALARALAPRPAVLLLDEPLSALDARLRHAMQLELKRLQRQVGTTFIFVTHDQEEALIMSDRIALMHRGRIEQLADVATLYHRPATAFAAEFVGQANLLEAELVSLDSQGARLRVSGDFELCVPAATWPQGVTQTRLMLRPEKIHLSQTPLTGDNVFTARVDTELFLGALDRFGLITARGTRVAAAAANESTLRPAIHAGEQVWCSVHPDDVVVLP